MQAELPILIADLAPEEFSFANFKTEENLKLGTLFPTLISHFLDSSLTFNDGLAEACRFMTVVGTFSSRGRMVTVLVSTISADEEIGCLLLLS